MSFTARGPARGWSAGLAARQVGDLVRQEVPSATISASARRRGRPGEATARPWRRRLHVPRLVAEGAGHAAAARRDGFHLHAGHGTQRLHGGRKAPKDFWWQWPWMCAAPRRASAAAAPAPSAGTRWRGKARSASLSRLAGRRAANSSRRVSRQDGSRPDHGASLADSASNVRRASRAPRPPARRRECAAAAERARLGGVCGRLHRVAAGGEDADGGAEVLRLVITVEGVAEEQDLAARAGGARGLGVVERVGHEGGQRALGRQAGQALAQPRQGRHAVAEGWPGTAPGWQGGRGKAAAPPGGPSWEAHAGHCGPPAPRSSSWPCRRRSGIRACSPCRRRRATAPPHPIVASASGPSCPVRASRRCWRGPRVRCSSSRVAR
jgi:hypothetical protein